MNRQTFFMRVNNGQIRLMIRECQTSPSLHPDPLIHDIRIEEF